MEEYLDRILKINAVYFFDMKEYTSDGLLHELYDPENGKYFGLSREQIRQVKESDLSEDAKIQWIEDYLKKSKHEAIVFNCHENDNKTVSFSIKKFK